MRIGHVQADPRYAGVLAAQEEPHSYLGAPLVAAGNTIGALQTFASQAGLALYNARLMDEAERHAREEDTSPIPFPGGGRPESS